MTRGDRQEQGYTLGDGYERKRKIGQNLYLIFVQLPASVIFGLTLGGDHLWVTLLTGGILLTWSVMATATMRGRPCVVCGQRRGVGALPLDSNWRRAWWDPRPPRRDAFTWVCQIHLLEVLEAEARRRAALAAPGSDAPEPAASPQPPTDPLPDAPR